LPPPRPSRVAQGHPFRRNAMAAPFSLFSCCVVASGPSHRDIELIPIIGGGSAASYLGQVESGHEDPGFAPIEAFFEPARQQEQRLWAARHLAADPKAEGQLRQDDLVTEFCQCATGLQVRPTYPEVDNLLGRCEPMQPHVVARALVEQLSWASAGELDWRPRLRALMVLHRLCMSSGGSWRHAARLTLEDSEHIVEHLVAHVPQCQAEAAEALALFDTMCEEDALQPLNEELPCGPMGHDAARSSSCPRPRGFPWRHAKSLSRPDGESASGDERLGMPEAPCPRVARKHAESFLYYRRCGLELRRQSRQQRHRSATDREPLLSEGRGEEGGAVARDERVGLELVGEVQCG